MSSKTKLNIVLDLDSTLINSTEDIEDLKDLHLDDPENSYLASRIYNLDLVDVTEAVGTGSRVPYWGAFRPHVHEFLLFASQYFQRTIIWSAGQYRYVRAVCDNLFKDSHQPARIYSFDDCAQVDTSDGRILYKPLSKIYGDPEFKGVVTAENTLVLDDRNDTFRDNPDNGINIPGYSPTMTAVGIMIEDESLLQLMSWLSLDKVRNSNDVRDLDKSRIFTTSLNEYKRMLKNNPLLFEPPSVSLADDIGYLKNMGQQEHVPMVMPEIEEIDI